MNYVRWRTFNAKVERRKGRKGDFLGIDEWGKLIADF